jgi:EAL and modified HD-GYP domain-containing signal transduction protein
LDALLDKPLANLLDSLPLSDELRSALLDKQGAAGQALEDVLRYERGDWQAIDNSPLPVEVLVRAYLDAVYWAKELHLQIND